MESSDQFAVIEGIDGAGKTTVCEHICEDRGYTYMTQPEDSWVGEVARRGLNEDVEPACDLFLHMAAHANQQTKLKSELQTGSVVMDRYYHSRVAYQAVQSDFSPKEIMDFHRDWTIEPTQVIVLDLPAEVALDRKEESKDKFEKIEFLSQVRSVYKDAFGDRDEVHFLSADRPRQEVLNEVKRVLSSP
ncbi:dTMP kinase [Haloarcula marina]|uniref:dTMP kinase n=1 Tax=Haloarcula marina TaxID=2961574 RepID=UPI0020B6648B|nr:dTMP kinase [Halomicroarcula marina]